MVLWEEIHEQPEAISGFITRQREPAAELARWMTSTGATHVVAVARGTSDNAARYAQYLWGARNGWSVGLAAPALFSVYRTPPKLDGALVVGISQSGQSPDIVSVLTEAGRQGRPTLAICNDAASPLAGAADRVLALGIGPERAIAATKSYTAQLTALAAVSEAISPTDGGGLDELPGWLAAMLATSDAAAGAAADCAGAGHFATLARGFNLSTAFEWALKVQELAYTPAQAYSTADFLHGPVAVAEPGFPILAVAPTGPPLADVRATLAELVEARRAALVVVTDDAATAALTPHVLRLPDGVPEWLTPIVAIVGCQLFAYHLTVAKGIDPDEPRGLAKVTRTR